MHGCSHVSAVPADLFVENSLLENDFERMTNQVGGVYELIISAAWETDIHAKRWSILLEIL